MLKLLIKKQMTEIFRSYFYDAKNNKARSRSSTIGLILLFVLLMLFVSLFLGAALSVALCEALVGVGLDWFYFAVLGVISILMGAFGSVFNTYSGLYLSKDNAQLLSLPIPPRMILLSRLLSVYLLGLLYSALIYIPAMIVYWVLASAAVSVLIGSFLLLVLISLVTTVLSCLFGWVVAKISRYLKNRGVWAAIGSLIFIAAYYFIYFKAQDLLAYVLAHVEEIGETVRRSAYPFYLFGCVGTGDPLAVLLVSAAVLALSALTYWILARSFLQIATATEKGTRVRYREKHVKKVGIGRALLRKELRRFVGSSAYMLNCGFGVLFLTAAGVFFLIKGNALRDMLAANFEASTGMIAIFAFVAACLLASMNDMAAPSVSLEGRELWILQSLPVSPLAVLRAKALLQILLTGIPMLIYVICVAIVLFAASPLDTILSAFAALSFVPLSALFSLFLGLRHPNLTWTNEIVPIKQSMSVMISLFGVWGYAIVAFFLSLVLSVFLPTAVILLFFLLLHIGLSLLLMHWFKTKGGALFAAL